MKKKRAVSSRVAHDRLFAAMEKREKACENLKRAKKGGKRAAEEYWDALDLLFPRHDDGHKPALCTDDSPNGWGNFGCERCDAINALEKRKITIWPRSVMTGSATEWAREKVREGEAAKIHGVGLKKK